MTVELTGLFVYPLKSARGIALEETELDDFGVRHDRRWMIVDPAGRMVTQREEPRLARIVPRFEADGLVLAAPGVGDVALPLAAPAAAARARAGIWDDEVDGAAVVAEATSWISEYLGAPHRIVHMPDDAFRAIDPHYAADRRRVSFADAFPFLLLSQESLDHLNGKLAEQLPMNRFRPNLVVRGAGPHAEDSWRRVRIGATQFDVVKPCARCAITTTDQETGARGKEPLRTLATYRRQGGKVMFGQNLIHDAPGRLRIGAVVEVLETA